ncbi:MAG: amidohydrolase [Sphingobacteriales bacterium]|nr:MAG: amidohydrolase [Sphingobacteriales bacterium]
MPKFTADYIYTPKGSPLPNAVVVTDNEGKILSINRHNDTDGDVQRLKGAIVPGFINAHCHLELSHLHQQIPQGEGLIAFVKNVLALRNIDEEAQLQAAETADKLMYQNGIVAVGDISNTALTTQIKAQSNIKYHTFVEMLGFDDGKAETIFANALRLQSNFSGQTSLVPHASYTVSKTLFALLNTYCQTNANLLTIHNQESPQENLLYQNKTGSFLDLYHYLGINIDSFEPQNKTSLATILPLLPTQQKKLLVHNTFTNIADIALANKISDEIYWCFCPNANLYIENQLPPIPQFLDNNFNLTLGTDSLASNHTLCMLTEMRTLLKHFTNLTFAQVLQWATLNGAQFLGFDDNLGSITVGKKPGLNLITNFSNGSITPQSEVVKLI